MNVPQLIKAFSGQYNLPVDVNAVLEHLRANGHDDNIEFIGVDLDPDILQGQIKVFHVREGVYSEPVRCVNIYYHRGHSSGWQRLIACKELIHVMDHNGARTTSREEVVKLADKIGLPPDMQDASSDGWQANVDRLAEFAAAAILLPMAARNVLLPYYKDGRLTGEDIARMADIPKRYVSFIMSDFWEQIHELLAG